jgi:uncharacterized RDD family membrane protein YckC
VDLDDTLTVATAEGLELRLTLAGLGSRFISGSVDLSIQAILTVILLIVCLGIGGGGGALLIVAILGSFVIWLLYPILFEVLAGGRTPGKRLCHLRVLRADGSPVDLQASAVRNLIRLLDGPATLYLPTVIGIAVTARDQRPGDIAAGTVVVREPRGTRGRAPTASDRPARLHDSELWEASAISPSELAAVRRFLERRETLDPSSRRQLAARLAAGLRTKVSGDGLDLGPEQFLETLVAARTDQGKRGPAENDS